MSLFTTDKIANLQKKSNDSIGVFKKAVADLASTNLEIEKEVEARAIQVAALNSESEALKSIKVDNEKFIGKINDFLGLK